MKYEIYKNLRTTDDFSVIDFISSGKKGEIHKRIIFLETEWEDIYNLAFGDVNSDNEIDDFNISDNGDRNKILATLYVVIKDYTSRYPRRFIYFSGSTIGRTRLYRMAISANFDLLSSEFEIYVEVNNHFIPVIRSNNINGFLVIRKNP